ncbi:hypothetical protein EI94DRAFT_901415 [Lactarius quietus]|nr:hypothetical protein EI94DRAFT_901415 [Lactarius quietus]
MVTPGESPPVAVSIDFTTPGPQLNRQRTSLVFCAPVKRPRTLYQMLARMCSPPRNTGNSSVKKDANKPPFTSHIIDVIGPKYRSTCITTVGIGKSYNPRPDSLRRQGNGTMYSMSGMSGEMAYRGVGQVHREYACACIRCYSARPVAGKALLVVSTYLGTVQLAAGP